MELLLTEEEQNGFKKKIETVKSKLMQVINAVVAKFKELKNRFYIKLNDKKVQSKLTDKEKKDLQEIKSEISKLEDKIRNSIKCVKELKSTMSKEEFVKAYADAKEEVKDAKQMLQTVYGDLANAYKEAKGRKIEESTDFDELLNEDEAVNSSMIHTVKTKLTEMVKKLVDQLNFMKNKLLVKLLDKKVQSKLTPEQQQQSFNAKTDMVGLQAQISQSAKTIKFLKNEMTKEEYETAVQESKQAIKLATVRLKELYSELVTLYKAANGQEAGQTKTSFIDKQTKKVTDAFSGFDI